MRTSKLLAPGALLCAILWGASAGAETDPPTPEASAESVLEAAAPSAEAEIAAPAAPADPVEVALPAEAEVLAGIGSDAMAEALEIEAPADQPAETVDGVEPRYETLPLERDASDTPQLGAVGYDSEGRRGRLHIVVSGDTLWDISDTYLGSAWVWPSIWQDNEDVANPHLIYPGDHIWITRTGMRRVTPEEAESLLAGAPEPLPAAPAPVPAAPVAVPEPIAVPDARPSFRVSGREAAGLISDEALRAAASVVDAVPNRVMLSQGDEVYIGLGEGDAAAGDQFTIFRTNEKVLDPETGRLLGHHVEVLGWVEIFEVDAESSLGRILRSNAEIERGDRVVPRPPVPTEIELRESPVGVRGQVSFFPNSRTVMATVDFVYLNRGQLDGLEVGSPLEIYRSSFDARESVRDENVRVPERTVAQLLVVDTQPESAVALVVHTDTELVVGDTFRAPEIPVALASDL